MGNVRLATNPVAIIHENTQSDCPMYTFRVEACDQGWALYRSRSLRPSVCADSLAELIKVATPLLSKHGALVRIRSPGGGFHELKFEKANVVEKFAGE